MKCCSSKRGQGVKSMTIEIKSKIPFSLFNSKALFNPYQYKPFFSVMEFNENNSKYEWNNKNLFITDEVGVGKTFEAGIILQELIKNNHNISILIICPVKLCDNWEKEMRENFYISFNNYHKTKRYGQFNIIPYSYFSSKSDKEKEEDLQKEASPKEEIELPQLPDYDVLILDEAHYIRNKGALWKKIEKMIKENEENKAEKLKIFMTATPIFNSENDYYNITELLSTFETTTTLQGEANCYDFMLTIKNESVKLNEIEKKIIEEIYEVVECYDDNGNPIIKNKYGRLTGFLKRISASSIYSLKQFINKREQFESDYDFKNDDDYNSDDLEKIDPGLMDLCNAWTDKDDSKFEVLSNLLSEIKEEGTGSKKPLKVIIFSCFLSTCDYLENKLVSSYKVYTITGKTNAKKVNQQKKCFEDDENDAILICSDAAKEGHNLQFAKYLIHYDFPYTPAALGQRNGRIYRKGQENIPEAYYITVEDSYDERLFGEIIVEKTNIVKKAAAENLISILNVLPSDSEDYIKKCIGKYFDDSVDEREKRWFQDKNNLDKNPPDFERQEFRLQLARKFSEMKSIMDSGKEERERIWIFDEYKDLYENLKEGYREEFVELFGGREEEDMEALKDYYKKQYDEAMKFFITSVFGKKNQEVEFSKLCVDYLTKEKIETNGKFFCHDMIEDFVVEKEDDEKERMSMSEYKEQFKPLILMSKGIKLC